MDTRAWLIRLLVIAVAFASSAMCWDVAHSQETELSGLSEQNIVAPQVWSSSRSVRSAPHAIVVEGVEASVNIADQAATTSMVVRLYNPGGARQEAVLLIPVPAGASVRSFDFEGKSAEPTAKLLPEAEAIRTYKSIVAKLRDPALLEFAGYGLIRSSVFPVEPRGRQVVRVVYEELLERDDNRVDYLLPRSEMLSLSTVPWTITVNIRSSKAVSAVYSPSHPVVFSRKDTGGGTVTLSGGRTTEPGPFQLSYMLEKGEVTASLLAYPDAKSGGGYFLLLAGLPAEAQEAGAKSMKRELTLVLDRSGSMQGNKIEQAKAAALQVIEGLGDGEAFNIIDYNDHIERFSFKPVVKDAKTIADARAYVRSLQASGGTNLHDAVLEAVSQGPTQELLPLVLLLSDGLPTIGITSEVQIRTDVAKANVHGRRIFTFGVGHDVNAPLLDNIAQTSRAAMTVVQPDEDVEVKVSSLFSKLSGPILAAPALEAVDADGNVLAGTVRDVLPSVLPDMFKGDQLVVLGKYTGGGPLRFRLRGSYLGEARTYSLQFALEKATMKNAFVARLWASRRIAVLADAIRQMGAETAAVPRTNNTALPVDPRMKELTDEIVRLSTEFGVLTEYTAFLANEGTNLADRIAQNSTALDNFQQSAVLKRGGAHAQSQQNNIAEQRAQSKSNRANEFQDAEMNTVRITNVQQVGNRSFFRRGANWVDAQTVKDKPVPAPDEVVEFGSARFDEVLTRLTAQNNQGVLSLGGEALFELDGKVIKIVFPAESK
ncbi:MAG: VWA domain-containing protein [Planctomycetota bacterium]|nr:VWA domain-containing protein [Planctomycetota bacterium]